MMCRESCGEGGILAGWEIRPRKDTSILLPSWCGENKERKICTNPGHIGSARHPLMGSFFLEDVMNNYSSKSLDQGPPVEVEVG